MSTISDAPSLRESPEPSLADRLALFFDAMIEFWADGSSPDGSDIQDIAASLGLLEATAFDSERHEDHLGVGVEDGDEWFVVPPGVNKAIRHAEASVSARKDGSSPKTPSEATHDGEERA